MGDLQNELAGLQAHTVEFDNLQAKAEELKANYELYLEKRDQAQIEDAMDAQNLTNVGVAEQATIAYEPASPKVFVNMLLGGVTAVFLGFCAIYVADASRETVATPRELDHASRYPVLATVPRMVGLESPISLSEFRMHEELGA